MKGYDYVKSLLKDCPHDTPYHKEDCWEHTLMVLGILRAVKPWASLLHYAALFHDAGKPMVKDGGRYYGHEVVSANLWKDFALKNFDKLYAKEIFEVEKLIVNHMDPESEAARLDVMNLHGLKLLHWADKMGRFGDGWAEIRMPAEPEEVYDIVIDEASKMVAEELTVEDIPAYFEYLYIINKKPLLIIPIGPPASGKSTFRRKLAEALKDRFYALGLDDLRAELVGASMDSIDSETYRKAFEAGKEVDLRGKLVSKLKESKANILFSDETHTTKKSRKYIKNFRDYYKIAVYFYTDLDSCIQRDKSRHYSVGEDVVKRLYYRTRYPSFSEGFDKVLIYKI